jgi:lysyl-tRNA synthetase class 1
LSDNRLFWSDRIAEQIIYRVDHDEQLQELTKKHGFIILDEKTPSGQIHVGSGRGWIIHDVIARSLRDKGINAKFILSSDDMDPMDALPKLDNQDYWKQFMGKPFRDIPSPIDGYKSYAEYYFQEATSKFVDYGIEAELDSTGQRYINGDFNKTIKIALDNSEKIQSIFSRFYDTNVMQEKLPFNPKCEKCGKIGTTRATNWDTESELLSYTCETNYVEWAVGCGHEGIISPYNGNGKFPWKVEWASKWPTFGVLFETAGKDHFSAGGSRDVSMAISNEVFNYPPPLPSTTKKTPKGFVYDRGEAYEFFLVGGAKMSSSKGQGFPFSGMTRYAPGNILKFILVRTRPKTAINFDPSTDLERIYREFDDTETKYYEALSNPKLLENDKYFNAKRLYELSHIGKIPETQPPLVEFNFGVMMVQVTQSTDETITRLQEKEKLPNNMSKVHRTIVKERLDFFRLWVNDLAPDDKIIALRKPEGSLSELEIKVIKEFKELIISNSTEQDLLTAVKSTAGQNNLSIKDFYQIIYKILFNSNQGPRIIPYVIFNGSSAIVEHLEKILQ